MFFLSGVHCVELTQTDSMVVSPGQVLTLSCKISGYSVTDSSYCTHWIQQPAGKALEWVGEICGDGNTYYSDKLKSRFQVTRESSSNTVTLQGQNMQTEDTAVYYCARESQWHRAVTALFKNHTNTRYTNTQLCTKIFSISDPVSVIFNVHKN